MEVAKRKSLGARKKTKRNKGRHIRSIVAYLKSDGYLFAPLFSDFCQLKPQIQTHPPSNSESLKTGDFSVAGFEALMMDNVNKKKRRMSEKVNEYLKSDCHMYGPMISPSKLGSSIRENIQITELVTMELSTSTTTTREDNKIYRNLRSDIGEQTLHNGRINSPKRAQVILEEQRTGLSNETNLSPAFSSLQEKKMATSGQSRVTIK